MITLYQLKQNTFFKGVYNTPAKVKNFMLFLILIFILFVANMILYRPEGGNVKSIVKIILGLNSKTFNFIENHKDSLLIDKDVPIFDSKSDVKISMLHFMSDCVRINRPCIFTDLASDWELTKKLNQNEVPVE